MPGRGPFFRDSSESSPLEHHKGKNAFRLFLKLSEDPGAIRVDAGGPVDVAGTVLVWGAATPNGTDEVKARYGVSDVLTVEECVADLAAWRNPQFLELLKNRQDWTASRFEHLRSSNGQQQYDGTEQASPEVTTFVNDDQGYRWWLKENPEGFVVNTRFSLDPKYLVLHRAMCASVNRYKGMGTRPGGFTERAYSKICGRTVAGIEAYLREVTGTLQPMIRRCSLCTRRS